MGSVWDREVVGRQAWRKGESARQVHGSKAVGKGRHIQGRQQRQEGRSGKEGGKAGAQADEKIWGMRAGRAADEEG